LVHTGEEKSPGRVTRLPGPTNNTKMLGHYQNERSINPAKQASKSQIAKKRDWQFVGSPVLTRQGIPKAGECSMPRQCEGHRFCKKFQQKKMEAKGLSVYGRSLEIVIE